MRDINFVRDFAQKDMKIVRDFVQKNMEIAGDRRIKISREVTTLGSFYFDTFLRRLK